MSATAAIVRPAVARAGIQKHVRWHMFRHSSSTILIANGENVKSAASWTRWRRQGRRRPEWDGFALEQIY
jgi:Phage integrase family